MSCNNINAIFTVKGQGRQGQKRKSAESSPLTVHSKVCVVAVGCMQQAAADDTLGIMTSQQA